MVGKSRRQHSAQFKIDTASPVLDRGYTNAYAAETMGVDTGSIRRWERQLRDERGGQTPASRALSRHRHCLR